MQGLSENYYLNKSLQPIWYEQMQGATHWSDIAQARNNYLIIQYNIQEELSSLTMSKQLLIRKCVLYIDSAHLSNLCETVVYSFYSS